MTDAESTTSRALEAALSDQALSWIKLTPEIPRLRALDEAIEAFDAGERAAAKAAARWLREESRDSARAARTYLLVARQRVLAFYAIASTTVALQQRHRRRIGLDPSSASVSVPAALVAWIAKSPGDQVSGAQVLRHTAATARLVDRLQATTVLVVDPFDEDTAKMWRGRFGFRRGAGEDGRRGRLWLPLSD